MSSNSSLELTLKPLSGNSNDLESAATAASSDSDSIKRPKSRMLRTVLAVFLIVGTVAAVGICTAIFAPGKGSSRKDQIDDEVRVPPSGNEQDLEANEMLYRRLVDNARYTRSRTGSGTRSRTGYSGSGRSGSGRKQLPPARPNGCFSEMSNDTIPAAHIKGKGRFDQLPEQPTGLTTTDPSHIEGYQTSWTCSDHMGRAFVDGGMIFNHSDKRLYVPKCGYYYISSQVYFQVSETEKKYVEHQMRVERNCPEADFNDFHIDGLSSIASVGSDSSSTQTRTRANSNVAASTYTGQIVKLCAGGRIYIQIPETIPCCADGRLEHITFFGAFLVAETSCSWPPA